MPTNSETLDNNSLTFEGLYSLSPGEQDKIVASMANADEWDEWKTKRDLVDERIKKHGLIEYDELREAVGSDPRYADYLSTQKRLEAFFIDNSHILPAINWDSFPAEKPTLMDRWGQVPSETAKMAVVTYTGAASTFFADEIDRQRELMAFDAEDRIKRFTKKIDKAETKRNKVMEQIDAIAMGESKDDIQDVQKKLNKYNAKIAGYNKVIDRASGIVRAVKDHPDAGKDYFLKKMTETRHDFIEKLETKDEKTVQKLRAIQLWDEQNPISWKAVATDPAQWISKGLAHAAPSLITIAGASQLGGPLGGIGAAVSMETGGYYASHVDELMQKELVPAHELEALKGLYQGMADEYIAEQKKFQELYPDIQHAPLPDPGVLAREMFFENYEQDENGNIWTKALTSSEAHDAIVGQAVLYGAVSGILEYLPFGRFVNAMGKGLTGTMKKTAMRNFMAIKSAKKFFGAGSATAKWMAGQSVLEMGTEMSQRVAEMVIESGGDVAFNEIWNDNELWESGWAGLMAGFFMAGIAGPSVHKKMKAYQHDQELIEEMQAIGMQMQLGNMSPAEALLEFDKKILERSKNWLANIRASGNEGLFKTMKGLFKKVPEVKLKGSDTYMGSDFRDALFDIPKSLRVLELDKQTDKKTLEAFKEKFTELTNAEEVSIDDMIKLKDELSTLVNAKDGPLSRVEEKYSKEIEKMYPKPEEVKVEEGAESGPDPPEITPTDERPQKEKEAEEKEYVTALISGKGVERLSPPNPKFKLKSHVHKHQEKTDTGEKVLEFIAFKGKADYFKEMGKEESARADRYIANFVKEKMGMEMSEKQIDEIKDMYARGFFPDGIQSLEKEMKLDREQQKEFLNWFAGNIEDMTQPDKEQHIGQFASYYSGQFDPLDILDAFDIIPMGSDMAKEMVDEYVAQQEQEMQKTAEEGLEVLPEEGGAVQEWVGKVDKSQSNAAKELGKKSATEIQKIIDEFQDAGHELDFSKAPKTSKGKLNWGKKKQIVGALVYNIAQIKRADQAIVVPKKEGSESKPTKVGQPKVVEEQIADIEKRRQEELNSFLTPNTGNKNTSIAWSFENNNTGQTVNVKQDKNVEELENTEWEVRRSETQGDGTQLVVERKMFKSRTEALEYANMRASHTQGNNTSRKSYNQEINDKYDAEIIEEVKKGNISLNEAKDIIGSRWLEKYDAELDALNNTETKGDIRFKDTIKRYPDISKTLLNQINNQNIPINDTDHDLAFGERVNYKNLIDNGILRVEKTFKQEKNMPQFAKVSLTEKGRNLMFDAIDEMKGSNWKQEVYSKVINEVNNLLSKEETARKALETKKEIKPADKQQDDKEIKSGVSELFESNPELANEVYEALRFKSNLPSVLDYKIGKIYNTQGKEIFAGVVDGQVYINKELLDKYSNKEVLDNQLPILNSILKNLNVYDRLVNGSKEQLVRFLVEHEKAHLDFERDGRKFKNEEVEEVYANGKALINIGILKSKDFDISGANEAAIRLSEYFPTKDEYIDDMVVLVAKAMDNATVSLSVTGYKVDVFKGSLWGKKLKTSSMDGFFFLQGKDGYPKNKEELKEAISKDIARNIPQSIKDKYWEKILKSLPDDEKALLSNWAYYTNVKSYTSQYGKPYFDFNKEPYPELNKGDREKYTEWDSFIGGIIGTFTGTGDDLWFANNLLADQEDSVIDWYKKLTPEKLDENIKSLSKAMAFKSMVVASFERGSSISALDPRARKIESIKEAYYEIKQRTEVLPPQLTSTSISQEITPQQKQQAQQKFQEYVNTTGKQDIEGFKEFVSKPAQQTSEVKYYEGNIKPEPNTIFVFGSNPEGRHGAGAAKVARDKFGAKYGQGEGLQGNAYALPTKDLRVKENRGLKSISPEQITESIKKLYEVANQNPNKQFKVAYRNTNEVSLNGYTGLEMIEMFNAAGVAPSNVIFSKEWVDTGKLNIQPTQQASEIEAKKVDIEFEEDPSAGYSRRTKRNASADATIAIAVDFNSAGEKLTKRMVKGQKKKYIPVDASNLDVTPERVEKIVDLLNEVGAKTLNIAGNGIYTMKGKHTQEEVDKFTYDLLKAVTEHPNLKNKIESIRTGGQTGFDEAGAKASQRLGIPTRVLAPKGWKFRPENGKDVSNKSAFMARFEASGEAPAKTENNQAKALAEILAETAPKQEQPAPAPLEIPADVYEAALAQKQKTAPKSQPKKAPKKVVPKEKKAPKKTITDSVSDLDKFQETLEAPELTIEDRKTYNKILKRLQKQMPFVKALNGKFIVDEIATNPNAVGRALGRGVEWTKEAGLETPPHEFFHIYWGMMEGTPIHKRAMKIIGKDAKGTEEELALYVGKYYVDRATANVPKKVVMWFRLFWSKLKQVFAPSKLTAKDIKEIVASKFYTSKIKSPTKLRNVPKYHDPLSEQKQLELDFSKEDGEGGLTDNTKEMRISLLHGEFSRILNRHVTADEFNQILEYATDLDIDGYESWVEAMEHFFKRGKIYNKPWTKEEIDFGKIFWQKMQSKVEREDIKIMDLLNVDNDGKVLGRKRFRPNNGYDPKSQRYLGKYMMRDFVGEEGAVDNLYLLPMNHILKAVDKRGEALEASQQLDEKDRKPYWLFKDAKSIKAGEIKYWDILFTERYYETKGEVLPMAFFAPKGGDASFLYFIRLDEKTVAIGADEKLWREYWNNEIAQGNVTDVMANEILKYYSANKKSNPLVMAQIIGRHETWKKVKWNKYAVDAKSMAEMFDRLKLDFAQGMVVRGLGDIKTVAIDPKEVIVVVDNKDVTKNLFFEGKYIGDGWMPVSGRLLNRIGSLIGRDRLPVLKTVQRHRTPDGENYINMKGLLGVIQSGMEFYKKNKDGSRGKAILRTGLKQEGSKWVVTIEFKNENYVWEEVDMIGTPDEIKQAQGEFSVLNTKMILPETAMRILQIPSKKSKTSATFPSQWVSMLSDPQMREENPEAIKIVEDYLEGIANTYWKRFLKLGMPDKEGKFTALHNELYRAIRDGEIPAEIDRYIEKLGPIAALLHPAITGRALMAIRNRLIVDGAFAGRRLGSGTITHFKPDMRGEVKEGGMIVSADNQKVFSQVLKEYKESDTYDKNFDTYGWKEKVELLNNFLKNNAIEILVHRVPVLDIYGAQVRRIQKLELGFQGDVAFFTHNDVFNVFQADHDGDKIIMNFLPSEVTSAIKVISSSEIYKKKRRVTRLNIFKHSESTGSVLDPASYVQMTSQIAIADGSQGALSNVKTQYYAAAQRGLKVMYGEKGPQFVYEVRDTEEHVVFEEGELDNDVLLDKLELLEEIYKRGDRITDDKGDVLGFDTWEEAKEHLEEGEEAYLVTTPDHILSVWLQASVDNAKEMLLSKWGYESKASVMKYVFKKKSGQKMFHSAALAHTLTQLSVSHLRRGEAMDQTHLNTTDLITASEKLKDFLNKDKIEGAKHLQKNYNDSRGKKVRLWDMEMNNGSTVIERVIASLDARLEEALAADGLMRDQWGGTPITFSEETLRQTHTEALRKLKNTEFVRKLEERASKEEKAEGRRVGHRLASEFKEIMAERKEVKEGRDKNVSLIKYDFNEEIQKYIDEFYEKFRKLSPDIQALTTLHFLRGANVQVDTILGKRMANIKTVIQLLPLDLMSEDVIIPYLKGWGESLTKTSEQKIAGNVPQYRANNLPALEEARRHDKERICPPND